MPSAKRIVPELQRVDVGDILPAVPGTRDAFIAREVQPGRALILVVPIQTATEDPDNKRRMSGPLRVSWALVLESLGSEATRLLSRGRVSSSWLAAAPASSARPSKAIFIERIYGLLARMPWGLMAPFAKTGHYLMESRMLRGIKMRAEREWANTSRAAGNGR